MNRLGFLKSQAILVLCLLLILGGTFISGTDFIFADSYGVVDADGGLNVRSGPGLDTSIVGSLSDGDRIVILGTSDGWHRINYDGETAYVSAEYVRLESTGGSGSSESGSSSGSGSGSTGSGSGNGSGSTSGSGSGTGSGSGSGAITSDSSFEAAITRFPDSYKPALRTLHSKYPNWTFTPQMTGLNWEDVVKRQSNPVYTNLVPSSWDDSFKSRDSEALNSFGQHIVFDSGDYVAASRAAISFYLDPRNFLNDTSIFQFYTMEFDGSTQTLAGINTILAGSFMSKPFPEDTFPSYAHLLMEAGKQANVNPLSLASMALMEQGYNGASPSVTGTAPGYEGYYNFFNIGAYAMAGNSAVTNGLIYAQSRGWNSRTKCIMESAKYIANNYNHAGQGTLYLKKFNVMNGLNSVGTHQYMTAVYAANSEGIKLQSGYKSVMNYALNFNIPVYNNMPSSPCPVPTAIQGGGSESSGSEGGNNTGGSEGGNSGTSGENSGGSGNASQNQKPSLVEVRMSGTDRVKTSLATASKLKTLMGVSSFQNVVIASGTSYADALSGTYLAKVKNAPVILVTKSSVGEVASYIRDNISSSGTVYIVGGESAVPRSMEGALSGLKTRRLAGVNRFETNLLVLSECGIQKGDILVCSGLNYPDALSASAVGKPILLVGKELTMAQKAFLDMVKGSRFHMIGGISAISNSQFAEIASYGSAERVYGDNRYETSMAVARRFFPGTQKNAILAFGGNYPDGISAGPLGAYLKAPILLVSPASYIPAKSFINSANVKNLYIMGGTAVIPTTLIDALY